MTWPYVVNDLSGDEIVRTFDEKNSKKEIKKSLELKKQSREKVINYMLNRKDTIIRLLAG